jgi:mannose-6-phosphate isomerase class I
MHYGPGFDVLFDCFDYNGRDMKQTLADVFIHPTEESVLEGGTIYSMIDYDKNQAFSMKKIVLNGRLLLPAFEGHYLIAVIKGTVAMEYDGGVLNVPQGRGIFVPALCGKLNVVGHGELIAAYPFML